MRKFDRGMRSFSRGKRVALGFLGFIVLATGVVTLMAGRLHYGNYWGAAVFAPFSVVVGVVVILVTIFMRRH